MGLGTHPTKPEFKKRTGPLLFALVTEADLYCIVIGDHGSFEDGETMEGRFKNARPQPPCGPISGAIGLIDNGVQNVSTA